MLSLLYCSYCTDFAPSTVALSVPRKVPKGQPGAFYDRCCLRLPPKLTHSRWLTLQSMPPIPTNARSLFAFRCPVSLLVSVGVLVSVQQGGSSDRELTAKKAKFDGGYASTMQGAEAFFNKPSPFQKAAQEKEAAAAAAAASTSAITDGSSSVDAKIADAVESAEMAAETTGTVIEVGGAAARSVQNK